MLRSCSPDCSLNPCIPGMQSRNPGWVPRFAYCPCCTLVQAGHWHSLAYATFNPCVILFRILISDLLLRNARWELRRTNLARSERLLASCGRGSRTHCTLEWLIESAKNYDFYDSDQTRNIYPSVTLYFYFLWKNLCQIFSNFSHSTGWFPIWPPLRGMEGGSIVD